MSSIHRETIKVLLYFFFFFIFYSTIVLVLRYKVQTILELFATKARCILFHCLVNRGESVIQFEARPHHSRRSLLGYSYLAVEGPWNVTGNTYKYLFCIKKVCQQSQNALYSRFIRKYHFASLENSLSEKVCLFFWGISESCSDCVLEKKF